MKQRANPALIGGFVLGALVLFLVVFIVFSSGKLFVEKHQYVVYFEGDVNGLIVGAPVKLRGVELGRVVEIDPVIDHNDHFYVEVIIELEEDVVRAVGQEVPVVKQTEAVAYLIEKGLRAQLNSQSMVTGQLFVRIDYFPDSEVHFRDIRDDLPEIPAVLSQGELLEKSVTRTVENIGQMQFAEISAALLSAIRGLDSLVRSRQLEGTLGDAKSAFRKTGVMMSNLDTNITVLATQVTHTSREIDSTLEQVNDLLGAMKQVASGGQYDVHQAVRELTAAARAVRLLAERLERHPEELLHGK